jgi:hypothetical protein|nr:MAG TPA: protein of unknown function (DUF4376) [Bacteriophage sp.]
MEDKKNKWLIEIVDGKPQSYVDCQYLNDEIKYFDESVEVLKSEINIEELHLYKFEKGKLVKAKELVKLEKELEKQNKINNILRELSNLKVEYSEAEFLFQGKYLQKNREKGDRDNLMGLVVLLRETGQTEYNGWKVIDKDTREHVYLKLTLEEMKILALHMQEQVTKAMKTESALIEKVKTLKDNEIEEFNARIEFDNLWNKKKGV